MAGMGRVLFCMSVVLAVILQSGLGRPVVEDSKEVKPVPAPPAANTAEVKTKRVPEAPKAGSTSKKETIDVVSDLSDMDRELPTEGEGERKTEKVKKVVETTTKTSSPSDDDRLEVADIRPVSLSNSVPVTTKELEEAKETEEADDDVGVIETDMGEDTYGADTDEDVDPDEDVNGVRDQSDDMDAENMEKAGQIASEAEHMENESPPPKQGKPKTEASTKSKDQKPAAKQDTKTADKTQAATTAH